MISGRKLLGEGGAFCGDGVRVGEEQAQPGRAVGTQARTV